MSQRVHYWSVTDTLIAVTISRGMGEHAHYKICKRSGVPIYGGNLDFCRYVCDRNHRFRALNGDNRILNSVLQ